mmetsp:Transcript_62988/g.136755  ORF Transcript_62988/g.136755 Transcript_62988/m.136755 type:complete len:221 (+) Transcript_62988:1439-2101(+)
MRHENTTLSGGILCPKSVCTERQTLKCFRLESIFNVVCQNWKDGISLLRFMVRSIRSTTSTLPTRMADWMKDEKSSSWKNLSLPSRSKARYKFKARVNSRWSRCLSICCSAALTEGRAASEVGTVDGRCLPSLTSPLWRLPLEAFRRGSSECTTPGSLSARSFSEALRLARCPTRCLQMMKETRKTVSTRISWVKAAKGTSLKAPISPPIELSIRDAVMI